MRRRASAFSLLGLVALVACDPGGEAFSLSPALWPEGELQIYLDLESTRQLEPDHISPLLLAHGPEGKTVGD